MTKVRRIKPQCAQQWRVMPNILLSPLILNVDTWRLHNLFYFLLICKIFKSQHDSVTYFIQPSALFSMCSLPELSYSVAKLLVLLCGSNCHHNDRWRNRLIDWAIRISKISRVCYLNITLDLGNLSQAYQNYRYYFFLRKTLYLLPTSHIRSLRGGKRLNNVYLHLYTYFKYKVLFYKGAT